MPNGDVIQYVIDGQNRRIAKRLNGKIVDRWIYSGQLSPVAEVDSLGDVISQFVGEYMIQGGTTYQLVTDHLGSVRLVVNISTGAIAERIDYDEFGNVAYDSNPGFQPYGFAGGLYDTETKLVRFGARDYDASTGRWMSKDPILFGGGETSLYGYAGNDPVNNVDPSGLKQMKALDVLNLIEENNNNRSDQDDLLVLALCWMESRFDPENVPNTGSATGLIGVNAEAASDAGFDDYHAYTSDPPYYDANNATNIQAGTIYLQQMVNAYDGDLTDALNAYKWGPGSVDAGTNNGLYAKKVLEMFNALKALRDKANGDDPCEKDIMNALQAIVK